MTSWSPCHASRGHSMIFTVSLMSLSILSLRVNWKKRKRTAEEKDNAETQSTLRLAEKSQEAEGVRTEFTELGAQSALRKLYAFTRTARSLTFGRRRF